jgi:glycosyltransferase involved in cell wall biosynthesis
MRPLRILFCTTSYPPEARGGSERQARLQAEELARRGHSVTVVCHGYDGRRTTTIEGVRVERLAGASGSRIPNLSYGVMLAAYLGTHAHQFDLIHVHLASFHVHIAALFALVSRRPLYLKLGTGGEQGDIAWLQPRARVTRMFGLRRANRIQAISDEIYEELRGIGIPESRIARIPNGYNERIFHQLKGNKSPLREKLGLPLDKTVVLFTGRFIVQKGILDLMQAWPSIETDDAVLVLVGAAPRRDYAVKGLASSGNVIVRGWTEDIEEYLQAADVLVLPSYSEGMSNSLLEAMACGLAVISTRVGAAPEMVEDGRSGILIAPGDPPALAAAMLRLTGDAELRASLGHKAAATVKERYSIASVIDRIEAAYEELLPLQRLKVR